MVGLGTFSYSLYLIHFPLILVEMALLRSYQLSAPTNFLIYALLGLPVIVGISYAFHRVFERPFMHIPSVKTSLRVVPLGYVPSIFGRFLQSLTPQTFFADVRFSAALIMQSATSAREIVKPNVGR